MSPPLRRVHSHVRMQRMRKPFASTPSKSASYGARPDRRGDGRLDGQAGGRRDGQPGGRRNGRPDARREAQFVETRFSHAEDDPDFGGFAPTQMFDDAAVPPREAALQRARRLFEVRRARRDGVDTGDHEYPPTMFGLDAPDASAPSAATPVPIARFMRRDSHLARQAGLYVALAVTMSAALFAAVLPLFHRH
jgi:hypothetical protein